jgi:hypothetical protein
MTACASLPDPFSSVFSRGQMFFPKKIKKNSPNELNPTSENYQGRRLGNNVLFRNEPERLLKTKQRFAFRFVTCLSTLTTGKVVL